MLDLKMMLTKILTAPTELHQATLASDVTGWVYYVQVGCMVTIHGVISVNTTKGSSAVLATGLPVPLKAWTVGTILPFSRSVGYLRISSAGQLAADSTIAAGTKDIRFAYSYLTAAH